MGTEIRTPIFPELKTIHALITRARKLTSIEDHGEFKPGLLAVGLEASVKVRANPGHAALE